MDVALSLIVEYLESVKFSFFIAVLGFLFAVFLYIKKFYTNPRLYVYPVEFGWKDFLGNWKSVFAILMGRKHLKTIYIKSSLVHSSEGANPPSYRTYVHASELMAIGKLVEDSARVYTRIDFSKLEDENIKLADNESVIFFGGYRHNEYLKDIVGKYMVGDEGSHGCVRYGGSEYLCEHRDEIVYKKDGFVKLRKNSDKYGDNRNPTEDFSTSFVTKDYGLIMRVKINGKIMVILAGKHMHGTFGAAMVFMNTEFQKKIKQKKYKYFVQLVEVNVNDNGIDVDSDKINWQAYEPIELKEA